MKILVTGGAGFIGHHFVENLLKNTDWDIVVLDKLTYAASGFDRLRDVKCFDEKRVSILTTDFTHKMPEGIIREMDAVDYIVHMGAETHVDRSIEDPEPFVYTNVVGTMHMLNFARFLKGKLKKFVYFSTDEVFGPAPVGKAYKEWDRYNSTNPYSATKAGGEELCLAYANTYGIPLIITHTMNVFGERQHPEKFIPSTISKVMKGESVIIHSDSTKTISGSRFYIHARNVASAIMFLLDKGENREKYNVVGEQEVTNLALAQKIADILGKPLKYEMQDFHSSRPGHDLRYALDGEKMKSIGWEVPMFFEDSLARTIRWTLESPKWLNL
jgi:dTDP-glucose 4,6-dehydratase